MYLWEVSDLSTPWCVYVAGTLRIAEHIEAGKSEIGMLASAAGADASSLLRVMRHLVAKGVFEEPRPCHFGLNELGRQFIGNPGFDLDGIGGRMAYAWGTLLSAVRTGKPAYHEAFGCGFWEDMEAHPDIGASFDAMMGPAGHRIPDPHVLLDENDWDSIRTVVDVGGGTGTLLAEVLRAYPRLEGILVDLPRPVSQSRQFFESAGVAPRATAVAQSFFDPLPAGKDLYMLKGVLHDWPDAEATAILRRCAEAARPSGRVVLLSGVSPNSEASPELLMLVLVGGKERTLDEFRELAREAGLRIHASGSQPSGRFIVECRAA